MNKQPSDSLFGTYRKLFTRWGITTRPEAENTLEAVEENQLGQQNDSTSEKKMDKEADNVVHFGTDTRAGLFAAMNGLLSEGSDLETMRQFFENNPDAIALLQEDNEKSRALRQQFERKVEQLLRSMGYTNPPTLTR